MRPFAFLLMVVAALPLPLARGEGGNRVAKRAEGAAKVREILEGQNPAAAVSRLAALGEEPYAARELSLAITGPLEQRRAVSAALAQLKNPAAEKALVQLLSDPDGSVRMNAAQGLGWLGSRATPSLLPLLKDPTSGVRKQAARALGAAHQRALGRALVTAASTEGELDVKVAMLESAGESGDRRQAGRLTPFLQGSSEATRHAAARALCLLHAPAGLAYARERLRSPDALERLQGLSLLDGVVGSAERTALKAATLDPDPRVAAGAGRRLYQAGEREAVDWLVHRAEGATGEAREAFEAELERLTLTEAQRQAIVARGRQP